ncbi:MAG: hypothetical protein WBM13_03625 [Bacteroidia bacterium]
MKVTRTIVITSLSIVILLVGGIYIFTKFVYNNKSCDFMNIDNIELRANINIPSVTNCSCNYDKRKDEKNIVFDIDTTIVDLSNYVSTWIFKKIDLRKFTSFDDFLILEHNRNDSNVESDFYFRQGSYKGNVYKMLLNRKSGRLWIFLKYAD